MGQAKLRGTKDERVARALQRNAERLAKRAAKKAQREEAERERVSQMPPEQQARYRTALHRQRMMTATLLGLVYGITEPPIRRKPYKPANAGNQR